MSTTIMTRDDEIIAVRFHGGRDIGTVVQLEITEAEMRAWAGTMVAEEGSSNWRTLADWLAVQDATIRYDNAIQRNQAVRDLENHRWAIKDGTCVSEMIRAAACDMRQRARDCTRQQLRAA